MSVKDDVNGILDQVNAKASEQDGKSINTIKLRFGSVAYCQENIDEFKELFKQQAQGTSAENAQIESERVPGNPFSDSVSLGEVMFNQS